MPTPPLHSVEVFTETGQLHPTSQTGRLFHLSFARLSKKSVMKSYLFAWHEELPHTGLRAAVFSREPGNGLPG